MVSEAQRRAVARYQQANTRQVTLRLNIRTDADVLARLREQPSMQGYLKRLVRDDIERERGDA